jgi:hypothetical protein
MRTPCSGKGRAGSFSYIKVQKMWTQKNKKVWYFNKIRRHWYLVEKIMLEGNNYGVI